MILLFKRTDDTGVPLELSVRRILVKVQHCMLVLTEQGKYMLINRHALDPSCPYFVQD